MISLKNGYKNIARGTALVMKIKEDLPEGMSGSGEIARAKACRGWKEHGASKKLWESASVADTEGISMTMVYTEAGKVGKGH